MNPGDSIYLRVRFKSDLNQTLKGRKRTEAARVDVIATYEYAGIVVGDTLRIYIQDYNPCGAYTDETHTEWKVFMCHNLGADDTAYPFVPQRSINGDYYQWGNKYPAATVDTPFEDAVFAWMMNYNLAPSEEAWSDARKTENDPCPPGWRVPTQGQWAAVKQYNKLGLVPDKYSGWDWDADSYGDGILIGDHLLLPDADGRKDYDGSSMNNVSYSSSYWSSTFSNSSRHYWNEIFTYAFYHSDYYSGVREELLLSGFPVRCIAE
jgi:uncharacterized protein (TIGR02145 family)